MAQVDKWLLFFAHASISYARYLSALRCTCQFEIRDDGKPKVRCEGDCMAQTATRYLDVLERKLEEAKAA